MEKVTGKYFQEIKLKMKKELSNIVKIGDLYTQS